MKCILSFLFVCLLCQNAEAHKSSPNDIPSLSAAITNQAQLSLSRLESNLSSSDIMTGVMIASPSRTNPNYFYHWVRDAALVMETYVGIAETNSTLATPRLQNWLGFETHLQTLSSPFGLGEPKYNVDGTVFTGPWSRPQNDGPALRARTMSLWALDLLSEGNSSFVQSSLTQAGGPIRTDFDYTMNHWQDPCYDVWEEVKGDHFFTRMAMLSSLKTGAALFQKIGDTAYANQLSATAGSVQMAMDNFWSDSLGLIYPTLNRVDGGDAKKANVDLAVLLGSLYFTSSTESYGVTDDRFLSSLKKLHDSFSFYEINQGSNTWMIGRYPEDIYDGFSFGGGNPWFLANTAYAEAQCRMAKLWSDQGSLTVSALNLNFLNDYISAPTTLNVGDTLGVRDPRFDRVISGLKAKANDYFAAVLSHAGANGELDEQFSRYNGYMRGAQDLSWSHASFIRAYKECKDVLDLN